MSHKKAIYQLVFLGILFTPLYFYAEGKDSTSIQNNSFVDIHTDIFAPSASSGNTCIRKDSVNRKNTHGFLLVSYKILTLSSNDEIMNVNSKYNFAILSSFYKNIHINNSFKGLFGLYVGYQGYLREIYKSEFLISQFIQHSYMIGLGIGIKKDVPLSNIYFLSTSIVISQNYLIHNNYIEYRDYRIRNDISNISFVNLFLQRKLNKNTFGLGIGLDYNSFFDSFNPSVNANYIF